MPTMLAMKARRFVGLFSSRQSLCCKIRKQSAQLYHHNRHAYTHLRLFSYLLREMKEQNLPQSPLGTLSCAKWHLCLQHVERGRFSPLFVLFWCFFFFLWITITCFRCLIMLTISRIFVFYQPAHTHNYVLVYII